MNGPLVLPRWPAGGKVVAIEQVGSAAARFCPHQHLRAQLLVLTKPLKLRGTLRASPELRERCGAVKMRVGVTAHSIEAYGEGKNAVIQEILAAAGFTADERQAIDAAQVPSHEG